MFTGNKRYSTWRASSEQRCSAEKNEDKVNWQEYSNRKLAKFIPGFLTGMCPRGQQGHLSVQQPDCHPRWCLSGTWSACYGVQTLENLRGCFISSSLVLFCTLLALSLSYTQWIIRKLEHKEPQGKFTEILLCEHWEQQKSQWICASSWAQDYQSKNLQW